MMSSIHRLQFCPNGSCRLYFYYYYEGFCWKNMLFPSNKTKYTADRTQTTPSFIDVCIKTNQSCTTNFVSRSSTISSAQNSAIPYYVLAILTRLGNSLKPCGFHFLGCHSWIFFIPVHFAFRPRSFPGRARVAQRQCVRRVRNSLVPTGFSLGQKNQSALPESTQL